MIVWHLENVLVKVILWWGGRNWSQKWPVAAYTHIVLAFISLHAKGFLLQAPETLFLSILQSWSMYDLTLYWPKVQEINSLGKRP